MREGSSEKRERGSSQRDRLWSESQGRGIAENINGFERDVVREGRMWREESSGKMSNWRMSRGGIVERRMCGGREGRGQVKRGNGGRRKGERRGSGKKGGVERKK